MKCKHHNEAYVVSTENKERSNEFKERVFQESLFSEISFGIFERTQCLLEFHFFEIWPESVGEIVLAIFTLIEEIPRVSDISTSSYNEIRGWKSSCIEKGEECFLVKRINISSFSHKLLYSSDNLLLPTIPDSEYEGHFCTLLSLSFCVLQEFYNMNWEDGWISNPLKSYALIYEFREKIVYAVLKKFVEIVQFLL